LKVIYNIKMQLFKFFFILIFKIKKWLVDNPNHGGLDKTHQILMD